MGDAAVVYVHGLWMSGRESFMLRRRLSARLDCQWVNFRYRHAVSSLDAVADALQAQLLLLRAPRIDLIGHSLGGRVILRCLERHVQQRPGRVLLLGTPCRPSRSAAALARFRAGRLLLGPLAAETLLYGAVQRWHGPQELGIIAGSRSLSLARLVTRFEQPNDGAVTVAETDLPGATARCVLPVSHTGMLLSAQVAQAAWSFLAQGRFPPTA